MQKRQIINMCSWHLFGVQQLILGTVVVPGEVGQQYHYVWIGAAGLGWHPVLVLLSKGGCLCDREDIFRPGTHLTIALTS